MNDDRGTIYIEGHDEDGNHMTTTDTISELVCKDATLDDNLAAFADMSRSLGRKESTVQVNLRIIRGVSKVVGGLDPARWTETNLQDYVKSDRFSGYKPATQQTTKAILKAYWEIIGRTDLLPPNLVYFWKARVVYGGGSNRYDELKAKTPTPSEVATLLDIARDVIMTHDDNVTVYRHMSVYLAAAYGLRRMEIAGLRLCDVDLDSETLHIEKSKGDKSRDVYMDVKITPEMWERFMVARSGVIANLRDGASGHVITNLDFLTDRAASLFFIRANGETGLPATPKLCALMVSRLASAILGRHINSHAFRHAKAFYLLEVARIAPHQAKEYLGHSNLQQTLEYSYTGVDEQKAAFANVDNGSEAAPVAVPVAPAPVSAGALDIAVSALTDALKAGKLSVETYAAAVAALNV